MLNSRIYFIYSHLWTHINLINLQKVTDKTNENSLILHHLVSLIIEFVYLVYTINKQITQSRKNLSSCLLCQPPTRKSLSQSCEKFHSFEMTFSILEDHAAKKRPIQSLIWEATSKKARLISQDLKNRRFGNQWPVICNFWRVIGGGRIFSRPRRVYTRKKNSSPLFHDDRRYEDTCPAPGQRGKNLTEQEIGRWQYRGTTRAIRHWCRAHYPTLSSFYT